jgi:hypothetical protein
MHAIIRRYEGVDGTRTAELTRSANDKLVPKLKDLSGFKGYYLIEAGDGVFSSLGLFERPEQVEESTKMASAWLRDERLEAAFPNPPTITSGAIVAQSDGVTA